MVLWLIRAGRYGEQEEVIFEKGITAIGWEELPDLSKFETSEDLRLKYIETYGDTKIRANGLRIGQLWKFAKEIKIGDLIVTPVKSPSAIAIGKIKGEYEYEKDSPNAKHQRKIEWMYTSIPRSEFPLEVLRSIGARLTVSKIKQENAKLYINELIAKHGNSNDKTINENISDEESEEIDLEEYSQDTIIKFLEKNFKEHDLTRLIEGVFKAKGYHTERSPPGRDGGVDIFASSGKMGFDDPKICIQVKSSRNPTDVKILRELEGVSKKFGANYEILVAWGGATKDAKREIRERFFTAKFWDQKKIIEELIENYDKLDNELRAEIPLRKIWAIIEE